MRAVLAATALVATALVATALSGCGAGMPHALLTTTPVPTPAEGCVSDDEQRLGGVALDAGNGATVQGVVLGAGGTGIVFANQAGDTLCTWKGWVGPLLAKGYRALVFDYSGGPADRDVVAGIDALRRRGVQKVFLVGASMDANAVLAAARQARPPVAGVVSAGPTVIPSEFNGDVRNLTQTITDADRQNFRLRPEFEGPQIGMKQPLAGARAEVPSPHALGVRAVR